MPHAPCHRQHSIADASTLVPVINEKQRTARLSFSSEEPYRQPRGQFPNLKEVISHADGCADLSRLNSGVGPLLLNHDPDKQIGVVEKAWISNGRGYAIVRFGPSALAEEVWQDVKAGVRRAVSFAYNTEKVEAPKRDGTYAVTKWTALEISIVSVPADATVGVGRALTQTLSAQPTNTDPNTPRTMPETLVPGTPQYIAEIRALASRVGFDDGTVDDAIAIEMPVSKFREMCFSKMASGSKPIHLANLDAQNTRSGGDFGFNIGNSNGHRYSIVRAVNEMVSRGRLSGLERELSDDVAKRTGKPSGGFYVPLEALNAPVRALSAGTDANGGYMVENHVAQELFIDRLRNAMIVQRLGATMLPGLSSNVDIPRLTGSATAAWVAEVADATESEQTMDQVSLTPRGVTALVVYSKQLLIQTSGAVEQILRGDIASQLGTAVDLAAIAGLGTTDQPRGILNTTGIGAVVGGTNGLAPTWGNIVALETAVTTSNGNRNAVGYLTNGSVRGKLKTTPKQASGVEGAFIMGDEPFPGDSGFSMLNGYKCGVSEQVPSNLTKGTSNGVCSAIIFGNWADLLIGQFGALDIVVDGNTLAHKRQIRLVVSQWVDIGVRHPASFAAMKDALTA